MSSATCRNAAIGRGRFSNDGSETQCKARHGSGSAARQCSRCPVSFPRHFAVPRVYQDTRCSCSPNDNL